MRGFVFAFSLLMVGVLGCAGATAQDSMTPGMGGTSLEEVVLRQQQKIDQLQAQINELRLQDGAVLKAQQANQDYIDRASKYLTGFMKQKETDLRIVETNAKREWRFLFLLLFGFQAWMFMQQKKGRS